MQFDLGYKEFRHHVFQMLYATKKKVLKYDSKTQGSDVALNIIILYMQIK